MVLAVIEENGVRLRLNIVDTPGYGDQVNNDRWWAISDVVSSTSALTKAKLGPYRQVYQGSALGISAQGTYGTA